MSWSKNCVTSEIKRTPEITADDHVQSRSRIEIRFQSHNTKLNAPIVTSSIDNNIKIIENFKQEIKRTIARDNYRPETTTQPKDN